MKKLMTGIVGLALGAMTATAAIADGMPRGSIKDAPLPPPTCAYFGGFFVGGHFAWNDYKTGRNDHAGFLSPGGFQPSGFTEADEIGRAHV